MWLADWGHSEVGRTAREEGLGGRRFVSGEGGRAVSVWKGEDGYGFLVEVRTAYRRSSKAEIAPRLSTCSTGLQNLVPRASCRLYTDNTGL